MSEKSNLFNRLTKLFRSGPVIKRNVRNITAQRGSTAVEVFKKAHSDVYNATLSAYGAFDRMCLDLDTKIAVPGKEKFLTLRQLMELYPNGEQFVVYAFDHETNSVVPAWAHHPRSSGVRKTVKVTFDDGTFLVCTPDHPCMLRDGTFKDAGELEVGQSMARFDSQKNFFCHLTITSIEPWLEVETGDLTVDGYENFATDTIIVHNSRYSDFSEMESCISGDTLIAVPNGYITIKELSEKYDNDEIFIVYSYDHSKQQIVPAYGKQARKTVTAETVKITFDSGKTLICTPDHRVMRRDGTYCEAIELQPGDSMMPFYRRNLFSKTRKENDDHYRWIYTMNREESTVKNGWIAEHKLIAEWAANRKMLSNEEVHHINFIKYDNRPENLLIMDGKEHRAYHSKFLNEKKWSEDNKEWINKFRANHSKFMQDHNPATRKDITFELILNLCDRYGFNLYGLQRRLDCSLTPIYNRLESNGFSTFEEFAKAYDPNWRNNGHNNEKENNPRYDKNLTFIDVANHYKQGITLQQLADTLQTTPMKINYRLKHQGYRSWTDFKENFVNHKVVSVEKHETIDLYDLTVDGYKNYATDSIIVHNTPEICSALDIYAEETVSPDEHGKVLHVYSDNRKIHELLTHLFYDVLNVEFNLVMWVRNLPVHKDTIIPLLDGTDVTIESIAKRMQEEPDWQPWVHSVQDGTNRTVPGRINWCGLTRKDAQLVRVWLDDGSYLDCTPDHRFTMRNGAAKEAQHLKAGESLMPFYRKISSRSEGAAMDGYEQVYDARTNRYVYTHRRVAEILKEGILKNGRHMTTRHVVFNKRNNVPSNLDSIEKLSAFLDRLEDGKEFQSSFPVRQSMISTKSSSSKENLSQKNQNKDGFAALNHKVERIEWLKESSDVYCMEVLGPNNEHDRHRFMTLSNRILDDGSVVTNGSGICLENCKYGDFFLFNDINPDYGVINAYPISISEIEREEGYDPNDPAAVRFRWATQGNQLLENWQISHFRLLGNDAFLPYGSSVLEGARRIWRQLILIEDAMLVYRVIRAPERRVFYIDVGNVPPEEVANYLEQVQTSLKRNQIVDRKTGKVDLRYNPLSVEEDFFLPVRGGESGTKIDTLAGGQNTAAIEDVQYIQNKLFAALKIPKAYIGYDADIGCLTEDTKIPLLDGRTLTIKELVDEHESGKINWIYSFDSKGSPKPGRINKAWLSKRTKELCLVKLDNGQTVSCTPNHPFMLHDGSYLRADELRDGESLMSLRIDASLKTNHSSQKNWEHFENFDDDWTSDCFFLNQNKVVYVEFLNFDEPIDVYDLEIEGWHNFTLDAGIVVHNSKATLSQEDIRFSRTIQRIQKTVISELNKLAQIHLYCHGYDGEDLADFELHLSNPSTVAQMQKLEIIRTRFEIAGAAPEGSVNRAWIQKNVLGLTDAEIEEVRTGRIADKKSDLELEAVTADGEGKKEDTVADEAGGGGLGGLLGVSEEEEGEDLTAGDAKMGDLILGLPISPSASVQTKQQHNYNEADELIDISSLSILDANAPLKADAAIRAQSIEEERNAFGEEMPKKKVRRKGKRLRTAMPDLLGMVNHERSRDSLKDPFGRTTEPSKLIDESSFAPPRITFDLVRTLNKMSNVMGMSKKQNALLTESEGEGDPDGEA
jgi:intein/homing endonuclease